MSYFNIYRKRVNRYGNNIQERIQGKKEHDFEVFMNKSPNKVTAWNNEIILEKGYSAVLQTKEYDQDEVVDYLLVPLEQEIEMGTIIYTYNERHKNIKYEDKKNPGYRRWINYAIDPYTSTGYNRYTVVELESELSWVLDGIKYTSFAHATGGGSGARDKNINLKFRVQFSEAGVYLPNKRYSIVMPTHPTLKKNMKVSLGGEVWRVAGFDNISVKGVSYVTLEEALQDEKEDIPIANYRQLKNWTITTSLGSNFTIANGMVFDIHFFYKNEEKTPKFTIKCLDFKEDGVTPLFSTTIDGNKVKFISNIKQTPIETFLAVYIDGWDENDYIKVPLIIVSSSQVKTDAIIGAKEIYVGETSTFIIKGANDSDFMNLRLENDNTASIVERNNAERMIKIKGISIGTNRLYSTTGMFSYPFEVLSMWLGGNQ